MSTRCVPRPPPPAPYPRLAVMHVQKQAWRQSAYVCKLVAEGAQGAHRSASSNVLSVDDYMRIETSASQSKAQGHWPALTTCTCCFDI